LIFELGEKASGVVSLEKLWEIAKKFLKSFDLYHRVHNF
jgi:hypothetical protein